MTENYKPTTKFQSSTYLLGLTRHSWSLLKTQKTIPQSGIGIGIKEQRELSSLNKRILIVDDNPDIVLTFKKAFEEANQICGKKISFHVNAYNDPLLALSEFKLDFYDLMLVDINMPKMNGFDFCVKILDLDANPRVCFISSGLINQEALREQYPSLSIGCFIRKPVTMENLVKRVKAELE
jgi:DNA-binding response OmpR family regulator